MKYRRLGKTNLRVSVVGIGTWQYGGEWGKDFTQREVDQIFEAGRADGINLIDTAECYGDHTSEAFIGQAIRKDRANWIVATKFGHMFHGHLKRTDERGPDAVRIQVEDSLKALQTDYVDLLQYHSYANADFDNDALSAVLDELLKSGKVRHVGNSIGGHGDAVHQAKQSTARKVEVLQVVYNRLERAPEEMIFPMAVKQNLGVLARVPLASGYLSGKYKPDSIFPPGDVRHGHTRESIETKLKQVEQIKKTELPHGVNMAEWALAWCLQHPAVTAVIPGCKSVEQVFTNAQAANQAIVRDDHRLAWK